MTKKNTGEMTFLDHLDELRGTLIRTLIGLLIGVIACYFVSDYLQEMLLSVVRKHEGVKLALLAPTEGFVVQLKISLVAGIFVTIPWIFFQLWFFIAPGLYQNERKRVLPVVFFSSLCFISGAAFAWFILPWATTFFLSFATPTVENSWSLGKYFDFILRMFVAFGVVFEMPILVYFLARFGIVTPAFLRKYRRHAYVLVMVASAIITPPDIFTMVIMTLPMVILYEGSILLAVIARKRWEKSSNTDITDESETDIAEETT